MPLTLYFAHGSPPSRGVLLLMRKMKLEFDLKVIDLGAQEHLSKEFLKLNPRHQVPVLVDDDLILTESRAILGYLVSKYDKNSSLYPSDAAKRAKIDERLYYDATVVFPAGAQIIVSVLYERVKKIPEKQRENLINTLNVLESFLNQNSWFAGNALTIADISIVPTITTIKALGYDLTKHPKLNAWYQHLESSLPNFEENVNGANSLAERLFSIMDDKL
ncbi:unnamed protein product [Chironomus riparius]|uniref:glutathione transferase n=1 Tax=Chironomus riparius TaxID=315576 RepID=A0A9N9RIR8_9DIPT|nr:unnamed protein product [Chironomus riparius]